MLRHVIGLVAIAIIFSSCSTDLNLTGKYTEKAVVYALLNPKDNPNVGGNGHLFRIQKAFLGEESAFLMALQPDSSYFKYHDLRVELIEYNGATQTGRWQLDTIMISNKDTGDGAGDDVRFFGPTQRLYKTATTGSNAVNIDASRTYEVLLTKIGGSADSVIASSQTVIVDPSTFRWNNPNENSPSFPGTTRKMDLYGTSGQFKDYTIRFNVAAQAVLYEVWVRFHYREVINGVETEKSLVWKVQTVEIPSNVTDWQVQVSAESIYNRIGTGIQPNPNAIRYIGLAENSPSDPHPNDNQSYDFDFFIRLAGEDLFNYIDINNPTNAGVLQDKPVYTNIDNGLGIFSSRSEVEFKGLWLSPTAGQQLVNGTYTGDLGFIDD